MWGARPRDAASRPPSCANGRRSVLPSSQPPREPQLQARVKQLRSVVPGRGALTHEVDPAEAAQFGRELVAELTAHGDAGPGREERHGASSGALRRAVE